MSATPARASKTIWVQMLNATRVIDGLLYTTSGPAQAGFMSGTVSPYLSRQAAQRFEDSKDASGAKWAPLKPATVSWRVGLGFSPGTGKGEINVRTGNLRDWLKYPSIAATPTADGALMAWPSKTAGTESMQNRLAQAAGELNGPARWAIGYNANDVAHILGTMQAFLVSGAPRGY